MPNSSRMLKLSNYAPRHDRRRKQEALRKQRRKDDKHRSTSEVQNG